MKYMLAVDRTWCAKCKMCLQASAGQIVFDGENYPLEKEYREDVLAQVKQGVRKCPVGALTLHTATNLVGIPRIKGFHIYA